MSIYYQDNHIRIYNKDCRDMSELADNSVQCVVTSPPFWGLRKYSGEQDLIWGGDENCRHKWNDYTASLLHENRQGLGSFDVTPKFSIHGKGVGQASFCSLCGAWKGAYGLEPTPEMYIQHTIEILREIRRVLRKDGVVFWDIGDSYWGSGGEHYKGIGLQPAAIRRAGREIARITEKQKPHNILKPKDLCLIPFRVAIAAQEDGWWVRSVIIWSKPNPMPESVTDRPTESHEYILMLTKSAKYYWDADAVREAYTKPLNRWGGPEFRDSSHKYIELGGHDGQQHYGATSMFRKGRPVRPIEAGRNIRTVWEFPTQPYPEAHFAVFPEKLPELCIKAATPEVGCCSKCGAPWARVLEKKPSQFNIRVRDAKAGRATPEEGYKATEEEIERYPGNHPDPGYSRTIGWQPTCKCNADKVPSLVLDLFAGAGTTLWAAKNLNRQAIGYEISEKYCLLALDRNRQQVLL